MDICQNKLRHIRAIVLGISLTGLLLTSCRFLVLRHEWNKQWGPLIPHTSFPGDCGICHIPDRWDKLRDGFSFDHEKEAGYRLEGSHAEAACLRCHNDRGPVTVYLARGCGGCHPDPHAASMGLECEACHGQDNWEPIGLIAEHANTRFPLIGSHAIAPCENCHLEASAGQFRGASTQCDLCHRDDLARATSPDHAANGWTTNCQLCHVPLGWAGAYVRHDSFPLAGGHAGLNCIQCHTGPTLTGLSSDCYTCHSSDYLRGPDHVTLNFSQSCEQCHSTTAWTPAAFDHSAFALTGGHSGLDCSQCHTGGVYTGLSSDCYTCHSSNYQGAQDHASLSFPQDCTQCHSMTAWTPSSLDHSSFALTGGHASLNCSQCHTGGTLTGLTSDCYTCHSSNYQGAADHASLSFPQDCTQCHSTSAWTPASFNHTFPLTGPHNNRSCSDCHTSGSTSTFECIDCHDHRQDKMDDKHSGESGYSYNSQACYQCHPNGRS